MVHVPNVRVSSRIKAQFLWPDHLDAVDSRVVGAVVGVLRDGNTGGDVLAVVTAVASAVHNVSDPSDVDVVIQLDDVLDGAGFYYLWWDHLALALLVGGRESVAAGVEEQREAFAAAESVSENRDVTALHVLEENHRELVGVLELAQDTGQLQVGVGRMGRLEIGRRKLLLDLGDERAKILGHLIFLITSYFSIGILIAIKSYYK